MTDRPPRRRAPQSPSAPAGESVTCPFCHSTDTELISLFGSQLLVDQHRCRACRTYFEAVRDDLRNEGR